MQSRHYRCCALLVLLAIALLAQPSGFSQQAHPQKPGGQTLRITKGTKFTQEMVTETAMGGVSTKSDMTTEITVTEVSKTTIKYDEHMTGKGSAGGTEYDMPPTDTKDQEYTLPQASAPAETKPGETPAEATDMDVDTSVFKGKVSVLHAKTDSAESWASPKPFIADIKLGNGKTVHVHVTYAKSVSDSKGTKTTAEILSLADFPIVSLWMNTKSDMGGSGTVGTTEVLQDIQHPAPSK